jgi:hypothetical protein
MAMYAKCEELGVRLEALPLCLDFDSCYEGITERKGRKTSQNLNSPCYSNYK